MGGDGVKAKGRACHQGRGRVTFRRLVPVLQGEEHLQGEGGGIFKAGADGVQAASIIDG